MTGNTEHDDRKKKQDYIDSNGNDYDYGYVYEYDDDDDDENDDDNAISWTPPIIELEQWVLQ